MIYCYNRVYTTHGSFHGSVVQNWWWWNHDLPELPTGGTQWSQRRGNGTKCSDISGHIHHKHPPEVSLVINQLNDQSHLPRMFAAQISFFVGQVLSVVPPSSGWVSSGFGRPGQWIADGPHTQNTLSAGSMFQTYGLCHVFPGCAMVKSSTSWIIYIYNIQVVQVMQV